MPVDSLDNNHPESSEPELSEAESSELEQMLSHGRQDLLKLAQYRMPFGKYEGMRLLELPRPYVVWFHAKGFPPGELGRLLGITYEIKINGLEPLFNPLLK